jgi:hypothetical protein
MCCPVKYLKSPSISVGAWILDNDVTEPQSTGPRSKAFDPFCPARQEDGKGLVPARPREGILGTDPITQWATSQSRIGQWE